MKKSNIIYYFFILGQSLVYGFGNPMTKIAYESITPLWMLAARFSIAFVVMLVIFRKRIRASLFADNDIPENDSSQKNNPDKKRTAEKYGILKYRLWLPSAACCAGAYISCNLALDLTSATNVGFIMSLPVLFAPLLAMIFLRQRYEFRRLPVQLAAILGLFLLCCNGGVFAFGPGEALALLEALCLAGFLVFGERAMEEMDVMALTTLQVGLTAVISIAAALATDDISALAGVEMHAWWIILYLAITCTIIAYLLQNIAVRHLSSQTVSMLQCTQPILTAFASFILLGETLSGIGLAGAVIIVLCLIADSLVVARSSKAGMRNQNIH